MNKMKLNKRFRKMIQIPYDLDEVVIKENFTVILPMVIQQLEIQRQSYRTSYIENHLVDKQ